MLTPAEALQQERAQTKSAREFKGIYRTPHAGPAFRLAYISLRPSTHTLDSSTVCTLVCRSSCGKPGAPGRVTGEPDRYLRCICAAKGCGCSSLWSIICACIVAPGQTMLESALFLYNQMIRLRVALLVLARSKPRSGPALSTHWRAEPRIQQIPLAITM